MTNRKTISFFLLSFTFIIGSFFIACDKANNNDDDDDDNGTTEFTLSSTAFNDGGAIPIKHTCKGGNISPQLSWKNAPEGTNLFYIIVDDECAPCGSGTGACKHWQVLNLPSHIASIDEDADLMNEIPGVHLGRNYDGSTSWAGPCPPNKHTYTFTIYATNSSMQPIFNVSINRADFMNKYSDYVLGSASITCTFTP